MHLHVTLRDELVSGTDQRVVVRLGVWDNSNLRKNYTPTVHAAYERMLLEHPDVRSRLVERYGPQFAVVSVFVRPGEAHLRPGDSAELDDWLARPPADVRGQYREAVIAELAEAGFELLPTDTYYVDDAGEAIDRPIPGHYDIVVKDLDDATLDQLVRLFTEAIIKTSYRRKG